MDTKACQYCGSQIAAQATICPTCKYFQARWRNTIVFFAGITGFVTLLFSGLAFIADKAVEIYTNASWRDDVRVVSLSTGLYPHFSALISNVGSGPVFVSDIILRWDTANSSLYANKTINKGEFFWIGGNVVLPESDYNTFIYSRTGAPSPGVLADAGFDHETRPNKSCFLTVYELPDSDNISRMNEFFGRHGYKLATAQAAGQIIYFSLRSKKKIKTSFPVTVTFLRRAEQRCQTIPLE